MPTNNLDVSINPNFQLDVDDHGGQNRVAANPQATTITWHLTGILASGYFDPSDCFTLAINDPLNGRFGPPSVGANGNTVSVIDSHHDSSTNGTFIYQLRVHYNGAIYATGLLTSPTATVNNPNIVNH